MSNFNTDGFFDSDWEDRGDVAWNEFDWERYLREQDQVILRYLSAYEKVKSRPDRVDEAARLMGWDHANWTSEEGLDDSDDDEPDAARGEDEEADGDYDPYTLQKNPIFIASRALYSSLQKSWEALAGDPQRVPRGRAVGYAGTLFRGEANANLAIQALDMGDYALAVCQFKRALADLNRSFALLQAPPNGDEHRVFRNYREMALPRLFDLREIWLRVMQECREELSRKFEEED